MISNSLPVINFMAEGPNITLIALRGSLRVSELSFIGYITEQSLAELRADRVIIGTRAINVELGFTNDYLPETLTDRATLKIGREIVADHTLSASAWPLAARRGFALLSTRKLKAHIENLRNDLTIGKTNMTRR